MIEWLFTSVPYALLYDVAKDIKTYLKWDEKSKLIDFDWLGKSGFVSDCEAQGIEVHVFNSERVESAKLDGWEILYELDKPNRIRFRLVLKGREIPTVMGRRKKQVE